MGQCEVLRQWAQRRGVPERDIRTPREQERIGFVFSTKDRIPFTLEALSGIDTDPRIDLIWLDGSYSQSARDLPRTYTFHHARLVEVHLDVRGGPDAAIRYGLRRLVDRGYDFCGLLENDVILHPGWFPTLLGLFTLARGDGFPVGAATVRNLASRVLCFRPSYTVNWNIGAGMILFSRPAARIVLEHYEKSGLGTWTTASEVACFYAEEFGIDLSPAWELWFGRLDRRLSPDWAYDMILYRHGLGSVGSIPSLAHDLEFDVTADRRTRYVTREMGDKGLAYPRIRRSSLLRLRLMHETTHRVWKLRDRLWRT